MAISPIASVCDYIGQRVHQSEIERILSVADLNVKLHRQKDKILQQREARVAALFAGKSRAAVPAETPYEYYYYVDYDNCFLIYRQDLKKIVNSESSPREAELWMLEQFLTKKHGSAS